MPGDVLSIIMAERHSIKVERFMELLATAVGIVEQEAIGKLNEVSRRCFEQGYHSGQVEAYRYIAEFLELYQVLCMQNTQKGMAKEERNDKTD